MIWYRHTYQACASIVLAWVLGFNQLDAQSSYTLETLHTFHGGPSDGSYPGGLVESRGVLYGATTFGGNPGGGTIFSIAPPSAPGQKWIESVIYNFVGGATGTNPKGRLAVDTNGVLYGLAAFGSGKQSLIYSLSPPAVQGAPWSYQVLYVFPGPFSVAPNPQLTIGVGVIYGTTADGGVNDRGSVFSLSPPTSAGSPWLFTTLYSFYSLAGGIDGLFPSSEGRVIVGKDGTLYGTTSAGGQWTFGTVFSLTPPAVQGGGWTETVLYSFTGGADGGIPYGGVTSAGGGALLGTTSSGGFDQNGYTFGTVFELSPPGTPGGSWTESTLYSFLGGANGQAPEAGVTVGPGGILYGNAADGSVGSLVYSLSPVSGQGGSWSYAVLSDIAGGGFSGPLNGVLVTKDGAVYGTTFFQGGVNVGTVYRLVP